MRQSERSRPIYAKRKGGSSEGEASGKLQDPLYDKCRGRKATLQDKGEAEPQCGGCGEEYLVNGGVQGRFVEGDSEGLLCELGEQAEG